MLRPVAVLPGDAVVKTCRKCEKTAPETEFPASKRMQDALSSWCRECHNEATKAWRGRNPEAVERLNASRRIRHEPRTCGGCGGTFVPPRKDSSRCTWCRPARKRRERDAIREAA